MALKVRRTNEIHSKEANNWLKVLIVGPPGVGKTRSASTWPDPLYADAEGRLLSVRDRSVPAVQIKSTQDLDELRAALAQEPAVREKILGVPVQSVIIDTFDEVARVVEQERLRSEKAETFKMADWGWYGDTLRSILRGFRNLDMHVVINVHSKSDSDGETGRIIEKPAIKGQVGEEIAGYVDIAAFMVARTIIDPKTGERVPQRHLQLYQDPGHQWPKDHTGALPLEFPINLDDDYARMAQTIFGQPDPAAPVSSPVASVVMSTSESPRPAVKKQAVGKAVPVQPQMSTPEGVGRTMTETPLPDVIPESVPVPGTEPDLLAGLGKAEPEAAPVFVPACADCGEPVTNSDQVEFSMARWQVPLCRQDFAARKAAKR